MLQLKIFYRALRISTRKSSPHYKSRSNSVQRGKKILAIKLVSLAAKLFPRYRMKKLIIILLPALKGK